jgi:hypothetical protein
MEFLWDLQSTNVEFCRRGDAVVHTENGDFFVTPEERSMPLEEFADLLTRSRADPSLGVPYVQHQNGSFTQEFAQLVGQSNPVKSE